MRTSVLWCLAIGQLALAQQYPILPVPGAPTNVSTLFQDSIGRLWVGGDQLAVFDGTRFVFLSDYGMPPGVVRSIAEDSSGAIWVGSDVGVYRFNGERVEEITKGFGVSVIPSSPEVVIAAIGAAGGGLPTDTVLVQLRRNGISWNREEIQHLDSPGPLTVDHHDRLLFPGPFNGWSEIQLGDVVKWRAGAGRLATQHYNLSDDLPAVASAGPTRFLRDQYGCVWVGTSGEARYTCGDGAWRPAPFNGAAAGPALSEASDGTMLLVGNTILGVGRPGSFHVATLANGLPVLQSAIKAHDGTIWLGGPQGLYRFPSAFRMEYWTAREGVDDPFSIQRIGDDLFAGLKNSVGKLTKNRQRWQKLEASTSKGLVANLLPMGNDLLAAENKGGVFLIRSDGKILARNGSYEYGLRLAEASRNEYWLGGLTLAHLRIEGGSLTLQNHIFETQPSGNVLDIQYQPSTHRLWACYNGGLVTRNENDNWREITVKDGLLVAPCWSLAALPNGDVWYGYYNTPAFARIRPNQKGGYDVRQFRSGDGVPDPESLNFDVDRRGWLWRGGNHGLSVSDPANAEAGRWIFYDRSDGLSGVGVNSGSYFEDTDGSVWMGVDVSIFHFSPPSDLLAPQFAPQAFISSLSAGGGPPKMATSNLEFPRGTNIVAHLGSLQFDRRSAMRFRFRVLPGDSWHESNRLDLPLGKLSAGTHALEVQASLFSGPWSQTVRQSFQVLSPFWLAWPFLLACGAGAACATSGAYWLQSKRRASRAVLFPDLARWRAGALLPEVQDLDGEPLDSRFEVRDFLARGGFANVMDGYDRLQQQRCAIKIFRNELKDKAWILHTFQQEVAALGKIRHPNVVAIYAHGVTPSGAPYLVMEFVEGRSLREILGAGSLSPQRTARALRQLSGALDAIHALGIFHRDVKPENIIVRGEGSDCEESVLIDFSIAIVKDANETMYGLSRAAGTFDYMGPEQAIGYAEPSSDIYSLTKVVLEMLAGGRLTTLLPNAALDLPDRVRELARALSVGFSAASIAMLASALEFDPSRRPGVASDFAAPLIHDLELSAQIYRRPEHFL